MPAPGPRLVAGSHGAVNTLITREIYARWIKHPTESSSVIPKELYRPFLLPLSPLFQPRHPSKGKRISTGVSVSLARVCVSARWLLSPRHGWKLRSLCKPDKHMASEWNSLVSRNLPIAIEPMLTISYQEAMALYRLATALRLVLLLTELSLMFCFQAAKNVGSQKFYAKFKSYSKYPSSFLMGKPLLLLMNEGGIQTFCRPNCAGIASVKQQNNDCYLPTEG